MDKQLLLITGASRGIGAATAKLAAREGYEVCINYLQNDNAAKRVLEEIKSNGGKAHLFKGDVSDEEYVMGMFKKIDKIGRLNGVVNNVGILDKQIKVRDMDLKRITRMFKHNVISQFIIARESIKRMSTDLNGLGGVIVNVSSLAAKTGSPNEYIDYASSKGAIDSFTIGLAKEVASEGIRVNAVRPGFIDTDIHADGGEPDRLNRICSLIPLKRAGKPEEVAESILWLMSEKSSYTTGTLVDVAGGY